MTAGTVLGCLECDHEVPVVLPEGAYRLTEAGEIVVLDADRIIAAIALGVDTIAHHLAACHGITAANIIIATSPDGRSAAFTIAAASPRWRGWAAAALCALVIALTWAAGI